MFPGRSRRATRRNRAWSGCRTRPVSAAGFEAPPRAPNSNSVYRAGQLRDRTSDIVRLS